MIFSECENEMFDNFRSVQQSFLDSSVNNENKLTTSPYFNLGHTYDNRLNFLGKFNVVFT